VSIFKSTNNGLQSCYNFGISIVVPPSLNGQALAAALLKLYFQQEQENPNSTGCGGMSIDAYNNQGQASSNSPLDGEASAGNVQLFISDSNPKYSVDVALGPVDAPTEQFTVNY